MSGTILSDSLPIHRLAPLESLRKEWFWSVDAAGRYTYFSPSYVSLTGFTPPLGETIHGPGTRGHDATLPPRLRLAEDHASRDMSQDVRHDPARSRAGEALVLVSSWLPQFDAQGVFAGIMGVTRCSPGTVQQESPDAPGDGSIEGVAAVHEDDISAEDVTTRTNLLRTVLDTVPFGITVRDRQGDFRMANLAWCTFNGVKEHELLGKSIDELRERIGVKPQAVRMPDSLILSGGVSEAEGETRRRNARGEPRSIRVLRRPYLSGAGEIAGIVTVAVDITDQQKAEREAVLHRNNLQALVDERTDELVSAQRALLRQERLAALGQLTATVSHELRNPLATISQSALQLRRHALNTDERLERTFDRIDRSIQRCVAIIEQLLSFGQVRRERHIERRQLDRWLCGMLEGYDWAPGIEHAIELAAGVEIDVDTARLDQAMTNLLDNACQAIIGEAPEAEAEAESGTGTGTGTVSVRTRVSGERVEIVVSDTGPGIPPENRDVVLEPLFSTKTYGFGLGMPLAKQVALDHGGDVEIDETDSGGAAVTLWLPLVQPV